MVECDQSKSGTLSVMSSLSEREPNRTTLRSVQLSEAEFVYHSVNAVSSGCFKMISLTSSGG